ncbi:MAG TPA: PEP/pyruvate-binding domain-containing protein [Bacteroidales bacterium]|nr:PEP/pyruvate-binding domain-containing protein [Bacteroidales bacterium]
MKENFQSKALEANLAETRYKDIAIPLPLQKFIAISSEYYGINKRAQECVIEYLHPFSNRLFVVEQLREIVIADFWFYSGFSDPEKAFEQPLELYNNLLSEALKDDLARIVVRTLLEVAAKLYDSGPKYYPIIHQVIAILHTHLAKHAFSFISSTAAVVRYFEKIAGNDSFSEETSSLIRRILSAGIDFWEETSEIEKWYESRKHLLHNDFSETLRLAGRTFFDEQRKKLAVTRTWKELTTTIADFDQIAALLVSLSTKPDSFIDKFYYTFYLLHLPGLKPMKDRLIWSINRLLRSAVDEVNNDQLYDFINTIFELCNELRQEHMAAVLDCILTLGKRVIDRDQSDDKHFVNHFEKQLIDFGFETPGVVYVTNDWQISVNENHIKNIRVWLELIEYSQSVMEKLLSALIVNLRLGGIFISDTDLFQREITKVLNSNIAPYYKKVKQLTRIFPVYFHEIGAEGDIRNVTTHMDEISGRQDRLIHFLRKQVHTESNNTLIDLTRRIFKFWHDANRDALQPFLPADVFNSIDTQSELFSNVHDAVNKLCKTAGMDFPDLLEANHSEFLDWLNKVLPPTHRDYLRLSSIHSLYGLLKEKYSFETVDIIPILRRYSYIDPADIEQFGITLRKRNYEEALKLVYRFMEKLKKVIFNPETSQSWENIYHKRHIAIGIPSMYGTYREPKFEALGLTFRLEQIATRLMEKIVDQINLDYISAKTLNRILEVLDYFQEGLELDGIFNQGFNSNLAMLRYALTSRSFSLNQYINIFQFIADNVKTTIDKYFLRSYEYPLKIVIPQLFIGSKNYDEKEIQQIINRKSEEFFREVITSAFLVQPMDNFIARILNSLRTMIDQLPPEIISDIMSYNSDLVICSLSEETSRIDNQIFLGSKAFFLKKLCLAGFPVPPGFVLTTEVFRRRTAIDNLSHISKEMDDLIIKQLRKLEKITGSQFGNPRNPLLLSVRSGTAISMPGAMDTLLNVGMNDQFVAELSRQPNFAWTSWDCYRRFLQSWGMAAGIHRDVFDGIMNDYKERYSVDLKMYFLPEHMRQISLTYRRALSDYNVYFEEHPFKQLKHTIRCVFDSWDSERAKVYRRHLEIADEWGTAVIVQKMILGNLNSNSGTGVVFTQNPMRERPGVHFYGDFTLCSQGEDIVGGLVAPLPVGETQRKQLGMEGVSLQTLMPDIYKRIHQIATNMTENHGYSPQEIEFTFESENPQDLYILQTRDQDLQQSANIARFRTSPDQMQLKGRGIGIGGGAMNGIVAMSMAHLKQLVLQFPGEKLILVRPDTVPDDIGMIFECDGLLTAKGGATSHAAVTAVRLGKTCVVSCNTLLVNDQAGTCTIAGELFKPGDKIALDGRLGNIYRGHYPIEISGVKPRNP